MNVTHHSLSSSSQNFSRCFTSFSPRFVSVCIHLSSLLLSSLLPQLPSSFASHSPSKFHPPSILCNVFLHNILSLWVTFPLSLPSYLFLHLSLFSFTFLPSLTFLHALTNYLLLPLASSHLPIYTSPTTSRPSHLQNNYEREGQ